MPPRFAYWTIIAGGLPTSFRAAERDELMPTFRRLQQTHPDAEMKYFARGKLWESADEARRALERERERGDRDRRRASSERGGDRQRRGRDWRPGGEHRDPRQPFRDAKKAKNQERRQQRWRRKQDDRSASAPPTRPHGDPLSPRPERRTGIKGSRQGQSGARPNRPHRFGANRDKGPPRPKPPREATRGSAGKERPHASPRRRFERRHDAPPAPPRPDYDPPPGREPKPEPPPRPSEPEIKPPGPPERGSAPRDQGRPSRPDRKE
jgi:hypothetical protein